MEKDDRKFSGLLQQYRTTAKYNILHNTRTCMISLTHSRQAPHMHRGLPGIFSVKQSAITLLCCIKGKKKENLMLEKKY